MAKNKSASDKSKLRVAVVGCGAIAESCHIPGYRQHPSISEIILCDPVEKILRETQARFQIETTYTDFEEMLRRERIDLLSICTPNYLHAGMVIPAARKGIHILCEKPMTLSLAEAEKIRKAISVKRVKFMVAFSHRFRIANQIAKEMLVAGKIGQAFMIRVRFGHEGPYPGWGKTNWFYDKEKAGHGALMDMGIHAMDLVRYYAGDVSGIMARTATLLKPIPLDDNALMIVEFESGMLGYIDVSWTSKPGFNGVEIYGSGGTIIVDYERGLQYFDGEKAAWATIPVDEAEGSWERQMKYFVDCVIQDDDPEPGFLEGLASLKIALAAARSAESGKFVAVDSRARATP